MCYQFRDKEPGNLKITQETTIKIDKNMQASGRSNLPGFTRGSSSKQHEPKDAKRKIVSSDSKESSSAP
jgi:hypothetical protein